MPEIRETLVIIGIFKPIHIKQANNIQYSSIGDAYPVRELLVDGTNFKIISILLGFQ